MHALLPAFVSSLFLFYGIHVLMTRGRTRASLAFFGVTVLTGLWQGLWAFLFEAPDVATARMLAKLGWVAILPLPTVLYHFALEMAEHPDDHRWLIASYGLAAVLVVLLLGSDLVIDGVRRFSFGFYPKAGPLEAVHIAQTTALVFRSIWLLYAAQRHAAAEKRRRLQLCLCGVALYSLSAADYAVNYGLAPYPPGVVFIAGSPVIMAFAILKLDLMRPYALAATVAHEVRTPLATIRLQAAEIASAWPDLLHGYRLAIDHGLCEPPRHPALIERLPRLAGAIADEVACAHGVIDMALASITLERLDRRTFAPHSLRTCVDMALARYPFQYGERALVQVQAFSADWHFVGSDTLLMHVLFNLLKNALYAIRIAHQGHIEINARQDGDSCVLTIRDSAMGIPPSVQRRIFDPFFSTKLADNGSGVGLTFCRRVMEAFGGRIQCESVVGEYTLFTLRLPQAPAAKDHYGRPGHCPATRG
ncbi:sensor histidine kinase [Ralstonia solanacearum]|uniref:histidine kinase n=1 Tax=Ralstonia solanacearum CFBP2957 TaxID=859656 RepID=D8P261_RALSL|nr:sensor histidine kinase [Ralstonia solanacearum]CBJ52997.1 putative two-component sensor histidine kinase [Ralstonia solanacearum CFBP2957]